MSEFNIQRDGVASVPYPAELQNLVKLTAEAWREFCELPDSEKAKLATSNDFNGLGYENKLNSPNSADRKENFDITANGIELLNRPGISIVASDLIFGAAILTEQAKAVIAEAGTAMPAPGQPGGNLRELAEMSAGNAFFRLIHYLPGAAVGEVVGAAHTDHSGITAHLYESTGGCENLSFGTREWRPLPVAENGATVFAGMQGQLAAGGEVTALCHRIVANETTAAMGRLSMVSFVALEGWPAYDKRNNGRLQEKTPGFNYDETPAEFPRYFVGWNGTKV